MENLAMEITEHSGKRLEEAGRPGDNWTLFRIRQRFEQGICFL